MNKYMVLHLVAGHPLLPEFHLKADSLVKVVAWWGNVALAKLVTIRLRVQIFRVVHC